MKRALFLCFGLLAPALQAYAQTVVDGSDKAASPFHKSTLKKPRHKYSGTPTHFRKLTSHTTDDLSPIHI